MCSRDFVCKLDFVCNVFYVDTTYSPVNEIYSEVACIKN